MPYALWGNHLVTWGHHIAAWARPICLSPSCFNLRLGVTISNAHNLGVAAPIERAEVGRHRRHEQPVVSCEMALEMVAIGPSSCASERLPPMVPPAGFGARGD